MFFRSFLILTTFFGALVSCASITQKESITAEVVGLHEPSLPLCTDIQAINTTTTQHTPCILPINEQLLNHNRQVKPSNTTHRPHIHRERPERTPIWDDGKGISWCYLPGNQPRQTDVNSVCDAIPESWIVPRARKTEGFYGLHNCICSQWNLETASFRACNCDRCDSLTAKNLRDDCRQLNKDCTQKGFSSGYSYTGQRGKDNMLAVLNGVQMMGRYMHEQMDTQSLGEMTQPTCKSNDFDKSMVEDYEGLPEGRVKSEEEAKKPKVGGSNESLKEELLAIIDRVRWHLGASRF